MVHMMNGVSFRIEFTLGADYAAITEATGWIADEVATAEGTYEQIRAEAHRLVDLAVAKGRCSKHANRGAGSELKRGITLAWKRARLTPQRATQG